MVIGHTAVLMIHVLVVQRSLTVLRPSQAFQDIVICACRTLSVRDFSDSGVRDMYVQKQIAGEV